MSLNLGDLTLEQRTRIANKIKQAYDFKLPDLHYFNSNPCTAHEELTNGCRACGISLRRHQRVAVSWLYAAKKGLVADPVGSGKTGVGCGLVALVKQAGELEAGQKVLVVCRSPAAPQWEAEVRRMLPDFAVMTATGTPKQRTEKYLAPWDIAIIGYQMLAKDLEALQNFDIHLLIVDDVDAIRRRANQTAYCVKSIGRGADRIAILTATPLQKRLLELYCLLEVIGGRAVLGAEPAFKRRYIRGSRPVTYSNLDEFKRLISPLTLRRTVEEMDDVEMPAISAGNIFLELYPSQRERYEELRQGVLRIIKEQGEEIKHAEAMAKFSYGAQICAGLTTLGETDDKGTSIKLDWVEDMLVDGDLSEEKVVIFLNFKNTLRALQSRLTRNGIQFETIWGEDAKPENRLKAQQRFWDDPNCRILLGTSAIEQSLNLQVARHLICVDTLLNPARMQQLTGRIRRAGSAYKTVYVHNLFASETQEDGYLNLLEREQALSDFVWDESNELYESLSPLELMMLIGRSSTRS